MNDEKVWEQEYETHMAIPSSDRDAPAAALQVMLDIIDIKDETVLAVGCGNGRNIEYMLEEGPEEVYAVDFATSAIERTDDRLRDDGSDVALVRGDVTQGIPLQDDTVTMAVDMYTSCHFLDEQDREAYWDGLDRVLADDGLVMWSGLGKEDEYYSRFLDDDPREDIMVDPLNGVGKRLYSRDDLPVTGERFSCCSTFSLSFPDTVDGKQYERDIINAVYQHEGERSG